ncbi:hypothetical protein H311_04560, partial [Anncaliia algerae PRA109]
MKYTWNIFKYSKVCTNDDDLLTKDGLDLNTLSQTILHSEIEGERVKQERWLHLYSQTNKTLEICITDKLEIKLQIHSLNDIKYYLLESLSFKDKMKWMAKGRSFACRVNNKKFQISFYDKEEVSLFHKLFSQRINFRIEESVCEKYKEDFLQKMRILNGNLQFKRRKLINLESY